ncbi:MAG: carbamoyltransferase HypF [Opitutaceae bacterium]|nr:carbamoyltransferase HypF [Opitutaceae bacterium]
MNPATPQRDRLLRVRGTVQGVGFRPFVLRLAHELGVRGWVRNDAQGVLVRAVGDDRQLDQFAAQVVSRAPAAAHVAAAEWLDEPPPAEGVNGGFTIVASPVTAGAVETDAPVDLAPCPDCRRELADPANRRHAYPFINCTQCGPRYSIIERLPYDRPRTTMRAFPLCPECKREYEAPADRRFHAEPNACPVCGPHLRLTDPAGTVLAERAAALDQTVAALAAGRIVAVKGVGGFHLMVDATSDAAVAGLRRRKHREEKPFAVLFRDLATLRAWAEVSAEAAALLTSPRSPIVLVPKRPDRALAAGVAPGNPWIGALLPAAPLHLQLTAAHPTPLVATSANLSDEPLCTDDAEARERLAGIADLFLGHDRAIARPVDDSVVRFTRQGAAILLRRARGYAPTPLRLPARLSAPLVCVGAHLKNTVAVAAGERLVVSPHIGDLGGAATQDVFRRTIDTLASLLAVRPAGVVCDRHPDYASTRHAEACGLPVTAVQHHLAHVLAVLLEHGHSAHRVLGVAWDGTGYGPDGTIWGGEFILLDQGRARRFARLRPFRLPGGEAAVRDARRVALALVAEFDRGAAERLATRLGFTPAAAATLLAMREQGLNAPVTTSAGRLFDGVGALLGLGRHNAFEGQMPLAVEIAATAAPRAVAGLPFAVGPDGRGADWMIDWRPAVERLLAAGPDEAPALAAGFHRGLVDALVEVCCHAGVKTVALGGGCFQNALLRGLADERLAIAGFNVLAPVQLPPNDGAIAAGQALGALWNLTDVETP